MDDECSDLKILFHIRTEIPKKIINKGTLIKNVILKFVAASCEVGERPITKKIIEIVASHNNCDKKFKITVLIFSINPFVKSVLGMMNINKKTIKSIIFMVIILRNGIKIREVNR